MVDIVKFEDSARSGSTNRELEEEFSVSDSTVVRLRRKVKVPAPQVIGNYGGYRKELSYEPRFKSTAKSYRAGTLGISGDTVVTSDWHVPYHDPKLAERMIEVADSLDIRQIAIVGDLTDFASLSSFDPHDVEFSVKEELAQASSVLKSLVAHFEHVYYSPGNHELRLLRTLKFQVDMVDVGKWMLDNPRLHVTDQTVINLVSSGKHFRLTHPRTYSRNTATVASILAEKFHTNVLSAHGHFLGWKMSLSGQYLGADLGGLFDRWKVPYLHTSGDTTHPVWNSGFWIVQDGIATPYSNDITNWKKFGKVVP